MAEQRLNPPALDPNSHSAIQTKSRRGVFVRMFSSAIITQTILSATNFGVGLILIRRTSDLQYGYYILVSNATLLIAGLQEAFIQPPMVIRMTRSDRPERARLIGGLYRGQRQMLMVLGVASIAVLAVLWLAGWLDNQAGLLGLASVVVTVAVLYRTFFRMVLLAYRRSQDVLKADLCYALMLISGVPLATISPAPAATALFALGLAAVGGGTLLFKSLWRHEAWNNQGPPSMLREMAPLGGWAAAGSATHWAFSQGYNYVVAGALDVTAVAAIAATRLLMMPVNLLSSGITSLMMPTASGWLHAHGPATVLRRLTLIASGLASLALCYFAAVWWARDLLFAHVLHKQFAQRDMLLAIWSAVFLIMVFRDQLLYLPGSCGLYRSLAAVTGTSAIVSLAIGYVAIRYVGIVGGPLGVLAGELSNVSGIIYLSLRQVRRSRAEIQHK